MADVAERIKRHMNADHADSLRRYLEHFHSLSPFAARNALLIDITTSSLRITTASSPERASIDNTYTIVLTPAMHSLADARERLAALDHTCMRALGCSDITVKRYVPPRDPVHVVVFGLCVFTYLLLYRRANLDAATAPGWVRRALIHRFPAVFGFVYAVQPYVFYPMVAIHLLEAWIMEQRRLRVHSVPRGSALWWKWIASTFAEGFGSFQRLDAYVAQERRKKEAKKH